MKWILTFVFVLVWLNAFAQQDTVIEAVTITGRATNSTSFSGANFVTAIDTSVLEDFVDYSFEQILKDLGGIDVRQRGVGGTQADLSIRGSSFDQVLVLVDGVNVSDFQTGHHSLNLPLPGFVVKKIEILEGGMARMYGLNALAGVVNISTIDQIATDQVKGKMVLGQYGYQNFEGYAQFKGKTQVVLDFSRSLSNGYEKNTDFDIARAFLSINHGFSKSLSLSYKSGFLGKNFGALNFYTPLFPYQYEKIVNWLNILSLKYSKSRWSSRTAIYHRFQSDIFELFREGAGWYVRTDSGYFVMDSDTAKFVPGVYEPWNYYRSHNFHQTQLMGVTSRNTLVLGHGQKLSFGSEVRWEQIRSNVLGQPSDTTRFLFYPGAVLNHRASRLDVDMYGNYLVNSGHWTVSAGVLGVYSSQYGAHAYFGGDLSYSRKRFRVYLSANQSMREPTFTELYYRGPSNLGNPGLKPEQAMTYELGFKHFSRVSFSVAVFYRQGKNIIDWVRPSASDRWQAMNYARLNTYGFEVNLSVRNIARFMPQVYLTYRYLNQDKVQSQMLSKYVLDYMKQFVSVLFLGGYKKFGYRLNLIYADRNGGFELYNFDTKNFEHVDYKPYFLVNGSVWYRLGKARIFVSADNLLNVRYYDLSNVLLPGIWIKAGISFKFNHK